MALDITLGNIITIITLIVALAGSYYKLDKRIDMKTDKEITLNQIKSIELSLERLYAKIDNVERVLSELRNDMSSIDGDYKRVRNMVEVLKAEHDVMKGGHL